MIESSLETLHIIVKGRVQGVGFRATTKHYAHKLGLRGTVKNLPDGAVEIYIQGDKKNLDEFIEALRQDRGLAKIVHLTVDFYPHKKEYEDFRIIFS